MGGVRNREAKKAAAKVFSSGGGGGSKGPSTVDKRNQEQRCPHCDKVYTQSNLWRLKEHIASKHADKDGGTEIDGSGAPAAAAAAAAGAGLASAALPTTTNAPSTSVPATAAAAATASTGPAAAHVKAKAPAAASTSGATATADSTTSSGAVGGAGAAGGSNSGGTGGAAGGGEVMMDVGSVGGYYTCKSPKLLLQEHCARNHRPRPRYVTKRSQDTGRFTCKVVLPDTKRQENDIVIFLDEAFAAPDEPEAQQRAALAALQHVAGDRPLHNVLPKTYVPTWHAIGEAEAHRKKAASDRLAAEAQRRQREKERMAREALRAPQAVVMSDAKQKVVQSLLLDIQRQRPPVTHASSDASTASGAEEKLLDRLVVLGFRAQQARTALDAVRSPEKGLPDLLDWLLLNLPSDQLPSRFRAGSKTNAVTLIQPLQRLVDGDGESTSGSGGALGSHEAEAMHGSTRPTQGGGPATTDRAADGCSSISNEVAIVSEAASHLTVYGYQAAACEAALEACGGDEAAAHVKLFEEATGVTLGARHQAPSADQPSAGGSEDDDAAWAEEVMVLEAIYGDALACPSSSCIQVRLPLQDDIADRLRPSPSNSGRSSGGVSGANGGSDAAEETSSMVVLEFRRLTTAVCAQDEGGRGGMAHPDAPVLIGVRCAALPAAALQHLTVALAQQEETLLGEPFLHALATHASELLHDLDAELLAAPSSSTTESAAAAAASDAGPPLDASDLLPSPDMDTGTATEAAATTAAFESGEPRGWDDDNFEVGQFQGLALEDEDGQGIADLQHGLTDPVGADDDDAASRSGGAPAAARAARAAPPPRRRHVQLDVPVESERLWRHQEGLDQSPQHAEMRRQRRALPAYGMRDEVLRKVAESPVVVISGATGCGKSTQVPQYILEDAIASGTGGACSIMCTQPRRISALGLAHRVASERGEDVGGTVGYAVRLDTKQSARTRLLFCTTGILLRRLLTEPDLEDLTHVILDEVHERSIEIDLLLLLLRELAARRAAAVATGASARPGGGGPTAAAVAPLRLVLMSATADADLFVRYMQSRIGDVKGSLNTVTQLTIPGFTHPVRELYLEDVFDLTQYVVTRKSRYAKKQTKSEAQELVTALAGAAVAMAAAAEARAAADEWDAEPPPPPPGVHTEQAIKNLAIVDEEQLNFDLIAELLACVVSRQQQQGGAAFLQGWPAVNAAQLAAAGNAPGAVLVFLPGAPEINRLCRTLMGCEQLIDAAGGRQNLRILPLHGSLSAQDQARVFVRPPRGVTKIVLATNVAETSITIDDVTVVVDTGRAKEMQYDSERGLQRLQEQWVSQAAAMQRRGRAGRVRPGVCFRLFSTKTWQSLSTHTPPEMLRSPLESVCLLIKGMMQAAGQQAQRARRAGGGNGFFDGLGRDAKGELSLYAAVRVADVLGSCLSPPTLSAVVTAVQLLRAIGALDGAERLTGLGQHLNKMPMDPRIGKMLLYGCLLGCLDPVLTVAAALAHGRPLFLSGGTVDGGHRDLAGQRAPILTAAAAQRSDHVALVAAFNAWAHVMAKSGRSAGTALCGQMQLSESSLEAVAAGRAEYAGVLADLRFLPREAAAELSGRVGGYGRGGGGGGGGDVRSAAWLAQPANRNASNGRFLKAAICAGFYPNVLRVQHPPARFKQVDGGAFETDAAPQDVKFFDRHRGRAFLHPGSVNFHCGKFDSGWLVFTQMTHTTKLYVRESSMAPVYALLLFGGELKVDHEGGMVRVDEWAEFRAPAVVGVLVAKLREELDRTLLAKISDPDLDLAVNKALTAVMELLSTDGF